MSTYRLRLICFLSFANSTDIAADIVLKDFRAACLCAILYCTPLDQIGQVDAEHCTILHMTQQMFLLWDTMKFPKFGVVLEKLCYVML